MHYSCPVPSSLKMKKKRKRNLGSICKNDETDETSCFTSLSLTLGPLSSMWSSPKHFESYRLSLEDIISQDILSAIPSSLKQSLVVDPEDSNNENAFLFSVSLDVQGISFNNNRKLKADDEHEINDLSTIIAHINIKGQRENILNIVDSLLNQAEDSFSKLRAGLLTSHMQPNIEIAGVRSDYRHHELKQPKYVLRIIIGIIIIIIILYSISKISKKLLKYPNLNDMKDKLDIPIFYTIPRQKSFVNERKSVSSRI